MTPEPQRGTHPISDAVDLPPPDDPNLGKIIDGCRLSRLIARGGMGLVYQARHLVLSKDVAIKILSQDLAHDRDFIDRFISEAKTAALLEHPNLIQIHDVGKEEGLYYIHMQYIRGMSVADIISAQGPLDPITALRIAGHTAKGLAVAHRKSIVHRDIKPGNIMIDTEGEVKVADFGLAKNTLLLKGFTASGQVIGTPYFMSPEQCSGLPLDHRSDQYSLGATLFYMLCGKFPFDAEETLSVLYKHQREPLQFTPEQQAAIPEPVRQLLLKLMAKKPEDRFEKTDEIHLRCLDIVTQMKHAGGQSRPIAIAENQPIHVVPLDTSQSMLSALSGLRPLRGAPGAPTVKQRSLGFLADLLLAILMSVVLHLPFASQPPVMWFLIFPAYFVLMLTYNHGQTLGMMMTKTRLVNDDGSPLQWKKALLRTVLMLPSFLLFGAGFLLAIFREDRKTLHDAIAGTVAVTTQEA